MQSRNIILILTILLSVSCEEIDPDPIEAIPSFTLYAGDTISDELNYYKFDPSLLIKGDRIGDGNDYFYLDSTQLDLNNNGKYDLYFEYFMYYKDNDCDTSLSNDSVVVCCYPDADAFCWIQTYDNVEIAMEEVDYFGIIPKIFELGDVINTIQNWTSINNKNRFSIPTSRVYWDSDNYNSFMGIRIHEDYDTIYGWIRLNTHHSSGIEIYDYAIEK